MGGFIDHAVREFAKAAISPDFLALLRDAARKVFLALPNCWKKSSSGCLYRLRLIVKYLN